MDATAKKQLIIALIKDDLINTKLVNSLSAVGLNADNYLLHLSESIFKLLEIPNTVATEPLYEKYFALTKKAQTCDIGKGHAAFNKLSLDIYEFLIREKEAVAS